MGECGFQAPAEDGSSVLIAVSESSDRLHYAPFEPWDGKNITGAKLLIKAFGKCTTDHISMAGPWLRFRGHLDNISNNMLIEL
jgi:aconitate hydratase